MGGCFSVSLPCDQVVNQFSQWLCVRGSYIHNLSENLEALQKAMRLLKAKRDDVQGRVDMEEFTGRRRRLFQIQVWLTNVLSSENQVNDLLSTNTVELQRLCLCGFCSKNVKLSYIYGKRVVLMLREVESLSSQGEFDVVTEATPIAEVEELPIQPTIVGQETMLERVWNHLMEDKVGTVGLYGMGGVGKTTLLTQINNKFSQIGGGFEIVIWVVVSKNATIHKIQGGIGEKVGLDGKEWHEKSENQRALDIHNVLRRKKFVLLLDDIWEKVNFNVIGVPYPSRENGCKVAFTTRSRDVCRRMGVNDPIEVSCLDTQKAWDLFREKVGETTLGSHPDIPELAKKLVGKCRGLPLALNVIGETMACKSTIQEWRRAIDVLTSSASDFLGVEDEILPILKYSYDSLKYEQVKSCFLYCSLFIEDYLFDKERLIEYWIGEGFIDEKDGRDKALNQGYEIIGILVRACLLLEDGESYVKMHDVVREMALWISSDLGRNKEKCIVRAGLGLCEVPKMKNGKNVSRMSLMENDIEKLSESLNCPELITLLLRKNKNLRTISSEFFRCMPRLLVLDLSWNGSLNRLPDQISGLVSLRYLDLSWTRIKRLPIGLQELKMLIHLSLEYTTELESLDGISNLSSLRILRLQESNVWLDMSLMKELQLLEHLEFISTNISSSLVGELVYDPRVGKCTQHISIRERPGESIRVLVLPATTNLCGINIGNCGMWEINIEKTPWNNNQICPCFSNLTYVVIDDCDWLRDLTWLMFAPNLINLRVGLLKQLEDIISKEKAANALEKDKCNVLPFQKLEYLSFHYLPELKSIYWQALPFHRLRSLYIDNCPKLRRLPLDSKSVFNVDEFAIEYRGEEWIQGIEWEDEATRHRFLASCKFYQMYG
ncbi:P-loop containing nucleoside triphosphate hydrolase [Arabidopsis thaliana x Arabidopsis arenosa]|uniref:P-loop containing nucleoside triphosphate hydrolase n=1 Tax=Arabidopsis thaliana x Arabidopsis arenosa TaxID=1240361 RepID=A0A8T1Y8L9_9BRAS|nr:P-loop containing nucleoside triphosphate hydrolase [Arabidopsis thaliana x Arabidopsis arenosa]